MTIALSRSVALQVKKVIQIPWEKFQPGKRDNKRLNPETEKCSVSWHLIHKFWLSTLFAQLISFWRISTQIKLSSKNGQRLFFHQSLQSSFLLDLLKTWRQSYEKQNRQHSFLALITIILYQVLKYLN